jgi:hypothetical protein
MHRAIRLRSIALTAALLAVGSASAWATDGRKTLVELFTSQGCSSCPPADTLLADLQHDPDLITLSLPVDYWDYIGWKDTLASPEFSKRQKAYAAARGDNHVYTPQVVVNGLVHVVGSNREGILAAAKASFGLQGAMKIPLAVKMDGDMLRIDAGAAEADGAKWGGLWIMHVARSRTVSIGRGENSGRTVTYTNVVRDLSKVGEWGGRATHYDIPANELKTPDSDGYVLVLQASSGGRLGPVLNAYSGLPRE